MRGPWIDPPVRELVSGYVVDDESLSSLADTYDVSITTIRNRLKGAGVQMRRRGAPQGNQHARKGRMKDEDAEG
jgi:hypothetical protein